MSEIKALLESLDSLHIYTQSVTNRIIQRIHVIKEKIQELCEHKFEKRTTGGPRDNGEFDYVCLKCGSKY